jgi:hydrogenase large subunit
MCIRILGTPAEATHGITWPGNDGWLHDLAALPNTAGSTWKQKTVPLGVVSGWGGTEAPRGALMHMATIKTGKIQRYQCIVPTTWNGSPKDGAGNRGAIEEAMIGAAFSSAGATFTGQGGAPVSTSGGVEVLRIAQSFDPCIACAVH